MFGPDKCGLTSKLHFIIRYQNPKNSSISVSVFLFLYLKFRFPKNGKKTPKKTKNMLKV